MSCAQDIRIVSEADGQLAQCNPWNTYCGGPEHPEVICPLGAVLTV